MQKTNSSTDVMVELERTEAMKKRAARQAAKRELAPDDVSQVLCTVLPLGDGRISMGEHVPGLGTVHFDEGETFTIDLPIAVQHYVRGWVSFEGAREAAKTYNVEAERRLAAERAGDEAIEKLLAQVAG